MKLYSRYFNLRDHDTSTLWTDSQTTWVAMPHSV